MWILAFIVAAFIAFGFACMAVGILIVKSNDHGDSKGTLQDFDRGSFRLLDKKNKIRKPKF